MTREQVLNIVDNCFHMYASSYRQDAAEEAERQIDAIEGSDAQKNEFAKANVSTSVACPMCGSVVQPMTNADILKKLGEL